MDKENKNPQTKARPGVPIPEKGKVTDRVKELNAKDAVERGKGKEGERQEGTRGKEGKDLEKEEEKDVEQDVTMPGVTSKASSAAVAEPKAPQAKRWQVGTRLVSKPV